MDGCRIVLCNLPLWYLTELDIQIYYQCRLDLSRVGPWTTVEIDQSLSADSASPIHRPSLNVIHPHHLYKLDPSALSQSDPALRLFLA